ncbi:MAG TPA: RNA polymerase sigma factor [Kofleriaceae bacterium]|jgi:RNA polymerase sigma-70 factor (ECF subfamily)|nr:RNA polymerase sigma factor [Kofleriaceae bacterium]
MTAQHANAPPAPDPSDADVIADVLAGDKGRFAVLVKRHNQSAFRACRAVLRDNQEAEDAVQTAWLNAYRALASFRRDASFRTWVTRIAINEATTRLRRQRLSTVPIEDTTMTMTEGDNPEHTLFTRELARLLEREIDDLPEGLRSVLVLRDVLELDTAETAGCLGIQDDNVRVRLHRARQALGQRLTSSMQHLLEGAMPDVWRFDGDRCARTLDVVMAEIAKL